MKQQDEELLTSAVADLYKLNALYQDIWVTLTGVVGVDLLDGTKLPAGLTVEEKLERVSALNIKIGAITGPWI